MASKKKPSIYTDRGAIGSSEELDEYGVWVKSEPQNMSGGSIETDTMPDFADAVNIEDTNENYLDLDLPDLDELSEIASEQGLLEAPSLDDPLSTDDLASDDDFSITDTMLNDNIDELSAEESLSSDGEFTEITLDELINPIDTDGDAIPIEEVPLTEESFHVEELPHNNTELHGQQGLSNQLLLKIAEELSSIRSELSALKKDLIHVSTAPEKESKQESAFFGNENKEDDEKIALTGDELNTILSTADFTEEVAATESDDLNDGLEEFPDITITEELSAAVAIDNSADDVQHENDTSSINIDDIHVGGITDDSFTLEESDLDELAAKYTESNELVFGEETAANLDSFEDTLESIESDLSPHEESFLGEDEVEEDVLQHIDDESLGIPEDALSAETLEEALPDFAVEEDEELKHIREEGAQIMTPAPDALDTEYLTEEAQFNLPDDPLEDSLSGDIDGISEDKEFDLPVELTEAVIDETGLALEENEDIQEYPSLDDISVSLDMEDISISDTELEEDTEIENTDLTDHEEEIELLPPSLEDVLADGTDALTLDADVQNLADETILDETILDETLLDATLSDENLEDPIELDTVDADPLSTENFSDTVLETDTSLEKDTSIEGEREGEGEIPSGLKKELKTVLSYMDQLLESLPDDKIEEFARSEHYDTYKKLFKELGLT